MLVTGDGFRAGGTLLGEQLPVAVDTVRLIFHGREPFTTEHASTVRTAETLAVPRTVVVNDPTFADRLQHSILLLLLARALQALSDPYSQSTCLSVCLSLCRQL